MADTKPSSTVEDARLERSGDESTVLPSSEDRGPRVINTLALAHTSPRLERATVQYDGLLVEGRHDSPGQTIHRDVVEPGTLVKHYEIIRKLGAGGMGMVFLARDTRLARLVAIKFLLTYSGTDTQHFLAEARMTARCRHENIVVIHDVDEFAGYPYIVLEFVDGNTLREIMDDRNREKTAMGINIMLPVVRALACAHAMGIVHRDLKPENIMLSGSGHVKVLDFGIAKNISKPRVPTGKVDSSTAPSARAGAKDDGPIEGTMPYMAPEQWLGEPLDERTDIWAVGIMLFELAFGEHPLQTEQLVSIADLDKPMPSLRDLRPKAGDLADVVDRCLKKRRAGRFASASELQQALEALARIPQDVEKTNAETESPFAGLSAFQQADAGRFFGREAEVDVVVGRLRHQALVTIAGPSGSGKSSFVRAGVIPALTGARSNVETFIVRPGRHPLVALADVLARIEPNGASVEKADLETTAATLRSRPGYLGAQLRSRCRGHGAAHRIVLVVDQLEELYTLGIDPAERATFCACLEGVADDASSPLRVVATIRADFLDRLSEDRRFLSEVTRGIWFLPPMAREGLRNALVKPVEASGYHFEDEALVEEMLSGLEGTTTPLPILQFAITKLWEARDTERRLLTRVAYLALGGVAGALSTHADAVLSSLSLSDQHLAKSIVMTLVTPERTRAIVPLEELAALAPDGATGEEVVQHLAEARLLAIDATRGREGKTVELAHESLIERWGRLRQWLDENEQDGQFLEQVRHAAQQWERNGKGEGFLWRDRAAENAASWLERRQPDGLIGLGNREKQYLESVVHLAEQTKRWKRRLLAVTVATTAVFVVVVSILALQAVEQARRADIQARRADNEAQQTVDQARRADEQAKQAYEEARRARNVTRLAVARERQADPTTALALLREVEPGSVPPGWAELAGWARNANLVSSVLRHDARIEQVIFSPDGKRLIANCGVAKVVWIWNADGSGKPEVVRALESDTGVWSPDGKRFLFFSADDSVRLQAASSSDVPLVFRGHTKRVSIAAFSADGKRFVTGSHDNTVRIWNADGSGDPVVIETGNAAPQFVTFAPDGQHVAVALSDRTVHLWNANGKGDPVVLRGHAAGVWWVAYSPDGMHIASASVDKTARIWNVDGKGEPLILGAHSSTVQSVAWSPDGQRVLTASSDTTMRVWNADGRGEPLVLHAHTAEVASAAFSPDGNHIAAAAGDTIRIVKLGGSGQTTTLRGHENFVLSAVFTADGQHIVSASEDGTARVWPVNGIGEPVIFRHDYGPLAAEPSPDGTRIVTTTAEKNDEKTARIWNVDGTGKPVILRGHEHFIWSAAWSPDGQHVVTGSWDMTARVWQANGTGSPVILRGHEGHIFGTSFSPDGQRVATTSADKTIRIWKADGSGEPLILRGHDAQVVAAKFSPDGHRIASVSRDNTIRIWPIDGKGDALVLRGHDDSVWSVAWSPDGKRIVTASQDKTVRIWNADGTGEPLVLRGSALAYNGAGWSPDGKRVVAASDDKTITIWNDLEPLSGPDDQRLWSATSYCLPLEIRRRLLDFSETQSRMDLERCEQRVREQRR
jgi:WD40 repeat protein/serine/threonine protein kinase